MLKALATFDPAKGPLFTRHARWAARKAILSALTDKSRVIRLPAGVVADIRKIMAAQEQWDQSEVQPTLSDLAALTGLKPARVHLVLDVMNSTLNSITVGTHQDPEGVGVAALQRSRVSSLTCRWS